MNRRTKLQGIVAELKNGLLELESHASLLKKRIFDLEKHVDGTGLDHETDHNGSRPSTRIDVSDDRIWPFMLLDRLS